MDFSKVLDWLKARGAEKTTYVGIAAVLASVFGVEQFADPETIEAFGSTGMALIQGVFGILGLIGIFKKHPESPDAS